MENSPIIILGFGRSGTTWVSDIISKALGGLIIFEPFHPAVFEAALEECYTTEGSQILSKQIKSSLAKDLRNPWLIRNHLGVNPMELNDDYINTIWENCNIIGFKAIRANHIIPYLHKNISRRIVFVIRHPLAVISSIVNRPRFFEEFGFETHIELFKKNALHHPCISDSLRLEFSNCKTIKEKIAFMWTISNIIGTYDVDRCEVQLLHYEDLYKDPFKVSKDLLSNFNESTEIHPSYIFTPSMLTLKTVHGFNEDGNNFFKEGNSVFWKSTISTEEAEHLIHLIKSWVHDYPEAIKAINRYL